MPKLLKEEERVAKRDKQDEKPRETTVEFLASLAGVLVTGLFIITFILQAFEIPSASMVKTLLVGDHVFVNRVQFSPLTSWLGPLVPYSQIHHGDIVVFLSVDPRTPELYIVKRIINQSQLAARYCYTARTAAGPTRRITNEMV